MASLVFQGAWTNPVGQVDLQFGAGSDSNNTRTAIIEGTILALGATLKASSGLPALITGTLAAPDAAVFAVMDINVERNISSFGSPYQQATERNTSQQVSRWNSPPAIRPGTSTKWQEAARVSPDRTSRWQSSARIRQEPASRWEEAATAQIITGAQYQYSKGLTRRTKTQWEEASDLTARTQSKYTYPPKMDLYHNVTFETAADLTKQWISEAGQGDALGAGFGSAYEEAVDAPWFIDRTTPIVPIVPPWTPDNFNLHFCEIWRAARYRRLIFGVDPCTPNQEATFIIPTRRIYTVSNSAYIVRKADGRDIAASSVSLSINTDNYAWDMNAQVTGQQALDLVEGSDGQPVEVDLYINGTTWTLLIDQWALKEAARQRVGTISGRSRSAYLAGPYASARDYQEPYDRNAQQLAQQELPSGWAMGWEAQDWLVPGGAWNYKDMTPIQAIDRLAKAAGAYIAPDTNKDIITIKPRYPTAPWTWDEATPDIDIPRAIMMQRSSAKKPGSGINAVFVQGGAVGGKLAKIVRYGTAGDILGQTIVEELITDYDPATALGIAAISDSQRTATESYELPLSQDYGGLILPGTMIGSGTDNGSGFVRDWVGIARGVKVSAQAARAGSRGVSLNVTQNIDIQRNFGA